VVSNYIKFLEGKQAIVFADCISAGKKMEDEFKKFNIAAKLLTGNTPPKERLRGVMDYRDGKLKVLINVDLFDEGFDVPGTDAVIMARPTKSLGKYLQMFGRALRVAKGKEYAVIIDHVGNLAYHGLPDKIRKWTLDNIVKKRDTTNLIRICGNVSCNLPYDRWLDNCPFCNHEHDKLKRTSDMSAREALKIVDGDLVLLDPETIRELENEMNLEDPYEIEARVKRSIGEYAGISARKKQQERIQTQTELGEIIAVWCGREREMGFTDRQIRKRFMIRFTEGITVVLSLVNSEMKEFIKLIKEDLGVL